MNDFSPEKICSPLLREFLEKTLPHSEASCAALAFQFLAAFGNCVGRSAFIQTEADRQYANLFLVLVGQSAKGRKGTSWGHVRRIFNLVDAEWCLNRVTSGLSSGEGLCAALVPKKNEDVDDNEIVKPPDPRLMIVESEFASVLKVQERDGNTLSPVIRNAWDKGDLNVMTRKDPIKVVGAHVSIIGHITRVELQRALKLVEMANGFGNRFLWACVERSKLLPRGGNIEEVDFDDVVVGLKQSVRFSKNLGKIERDDEAFECWDGIYKELSVEKPGVVGMMTARAEPQILRIAMLLALLDASRVIRAEHLWTAYDIWKYCEESIEELFGRSFASPFSSKLADEISSKPNGLSRSEMFSVSGRHVTREQLDLAIADLVATKKFKLHTENTAGRSVERLVRV